MSNRSDMAKPGNEAHIASASTANVSGYLYNASRRLRVPAADGGRGTRRRVEIVSSAAVKTLHTTESAFKNNQEMDDEKPVLEVVVDEDGEEWDVVMPLSKVEGGVKDQTQEDKDAKLTRPPNDRTEMIAAKAEDGNDPEPLIAGSRPALTSMPQRFAADATEAERLELEKAARKAEKIAKLSFKISSLLAVIARGRCLYRAAMHPLILRGLLRMRFDGKDIGVVGSKRPRSGSSVRTTAVRAPKIFAIAVREAAELYEESCRLCGAAETLGACWVTLKKDGASNATSRAVLKLVNAINDRFVLEHTRADAAAAEMEGRGRSNDGGCLSDVPQLVIRKMLRDCLSSSPSHMNRFRNSKYPLPSALHFCVIFLSLARVVGFHTKIVLCEVPSSAAGPMAAAAALPASWCWVEVWCPQRQCILSVNPCGGVTTVWNSPHCISVSGDTVVDCTPRYVSKFSAISASRIDHSFGPSTEHYLSMIIKFKKFDSSRTVLDIITDRLCLNASATSLHILQREKKQLERLLYSEPVPTTLTALKQHPLYTLESGIARHEGIFPKDQTTIVGQVKGHCVYKRSAIRPLRSETGWLRENRQVRPGEEPYKIVAPPPSRPLGSPSRFFGLWQTDPFRPAEVPDGQPIPKLLNTNWYILLRCQPPASLLHLKQSGIARIARKMNVEFAQAVVGYEKKQAARNRRGTWEAVICGIVVREADADAVVRAHVEFSQLQKEQEDARRRLRALKWWKVFAQRLLATDRLHSQFLDGLRR